MNKKTTFWLLLVAAALVGLVVVSRRGDEGAKTAAEEPLVRAAPDSLRRIALQNSNTVVVCVRREGKWWIDYPVEAPADDVAMDRICRVLETQECLESVSTDELRNRGLSYGDFGLSTPTATITVEGSLGEKIIDVGSRAPLDQRLYAKRRDQPDIIVTQDRLLSILPSSVDQLRSKKVVHIDSGQVVRMGIHRPDGFVELSLTDDGWRIQQPLQTLADVSVVAGQLQTLDELSAERFIWDPAVAPPDSMTVTGETAAVGEPPFDVYRLAEDEASLRVEFMARGAEGPSELIVGASAEDGEVYARMRASDSIFTLQSEVLKPFTASVTDMRDRRLLPCQASEIGAVELSDRHTKVVLERHETGAWQITAPVQWKADGEVVADVLRQLAGLRIEGFTGVAGDDLTEWGLASPVCRLVVRKRTGTGDVATEERPGEAAGMEGLPSILLGRVAPEAEFGYALYVTGDGEAHSEAEKTILRLPAAPMRRLMQGLLDPLTYRNRLILSLFPDQIRRISISCSGRTQAAEREREADGWRVAGEEEPEADVIGGAIEDILFAVADLRALRFESFNAESLAPYGLNAPTCTVTFGLTAEAGIQKVLQLGFKAKTDGVFATIQGQDVVFVLPNEVVSLLTQTILKPLPGSAGDDRVEAGGE